MGRRKVGAAGVQQVPVLTAAEAAALIPDGATVTVSSSSALGCPDHVLEAVGERYARTGSPSGLTTIHPIGAGDMYGVLGIDHLAQRGLLARVIAGSFPSGPSYMEPPLIWQLIERDEVEAYNLPSGVLLHMHRAGGAGQPGLLSDVGLDTFVDPRHVGGRMNTRTTHDIVSVEVRDGQEWLFYPALRPDVAIIRATTADESGNLTFEDEGSTLGALDQAYATHNNGGLVIAQVKRLAERGSLSPQQVKVPGILVDTVVIHEDAWQTTRTRYDPAISGTIRRPLDAIDPAPWNVEKVLARRAAQELLPGETVNLGFGTAALVPRVLMEEGHAGTVTWAIEQGAVGGVPLTGFAFGCALNPDALMSSADQFTLLQGGGVDCAVLSFLEVDTQGSVNVHKLPGKAHVTAGVGGFADITSRTRRIVFVGAFTAGRSDIEVTDGRLVITRDGPVSKFVEQVGAVTFSGLRAVAQGQHVRYVTERCVLELRPEGLTVIEIAPGVDLDRDVLGRSGAKLRVADDVRVMDPVLFRPLPFGLTLGSTAPAPAKASGVIA